MKEIKVIRVAPYKAPEVIQIKNTLEALQNEVGGYIEAIYPYNDKVALICNEEGKINGLPLNRVIYSENGYTQDIIAGTFLITGLSSHSFASIGEYEKKYMDMFKRKSPLPYCKKCNRTLGVAIGDRIICSSNYDGTNICRKCREESK